MKYCKIDTSKRWKMNGVLIKLFDVVGHSMTLKLKWQEKVHSLEKSRVWQKNIHRNCSLIFLQIHFLSLLTRSVYIYPPVYIFFLHWSSYHIALQSMCMDVMKSSINRYMQEPKTVFMTDHPKYPHVSTFNSPVKNKNNVSQGA